MPTWMLSYASAYALTDQANTEVGGSQPVRAYFDGDIEREEYGRYGNPTVRGVEEKIAALLLRSRALTAAFPLYRSLVV